MNPDDLKKILDALSAADVREFSLQTGSYTLDLKRGPVVTGSAGSSASSPASNMGANNTGLTPSPSPAPAATSTPAVTPIPAETPAPVTPTPEPAAETPSAPARGTGTPVKAPIVGTFYAASSPDAPPYVKVGDRVQPGQVLCIIEAMKLMNEIEAEIGGTVREILVNNGEPVEYGQTLFTIE